MCDSCSNSYPHSHVGCEERDCEESNPHCHTYEYISLPDPPGTTRLEIIRMKLEGLV